MSREELINSLVDPDQEKQAKYSWDFRYQQEVLGMLLMDRVFLIQSLNLIQPNYFIEKAHETICYILFDYFQKYNQLPPKFVIIDEIKQRFGEDKRAFIFVAELEAVTSCFVPGLESREACLDKIAEFAKEQSLRKGVSQTLSLLQNKDPDK